ARGAGAPAGGAAPPPPRPRRARSRLERLGRRRRLGHARSALLLGLGLGTHEPGLGCAEMTGRPGAQAPLRPARDDRAGRSRPAGTPERAEQPATRPTTPGGSVRSRRPIAIRDRA